MSLSGPPPLSQLTNPGYNPPSQQIAVSGEAGVLS